MRIQRIALVFVAVAFPLHAQPGPQLDSAAQEQPRLGPYEALVPSEGQSDSARNAALRGAMQSVVERLAGPTALSTYQGQSLLDQAPQYVLSYGFEVDGTQLPPQTLLRANFDGNAIRKALTDAGLIAAPQIERVPIDISGIDNLQDYQRVVSHLRGLGGVQTAVPTAGSGNQVRFAVEVDGGQRALELALSLGGLLRQERYASYDAPAQYALAQ